MGKFYNLDDETREFAQKKVKFCLVIYDIVSNKRRLKLSKLLEGYGVRVQRSCFEINLEQTYYKQLVAELEKFYSQEEGDNIILYTGHKEEKITFQAHSEEDSDLVGDFLFF